MNTAMSNASRYFLNLGFYPGQIEFGAGLPRKRMMWSLTAYVLLFSGLFSRQCIDISKAPVAFSTNNLQAPVLLASGMVAVALFPLFTQWFNSKRRTPSWEHVLWAFSFGFFINLGSEVIWKKFF